MDLGLEGKVAIVTGGSGGIGSAVCEAFAKEGANVVVNYYGDWEKDTAEELAKRFGDDFGVSAVAIRADVGIEAEVINLFNMTLERFGRVDIIINNAAAVGKNYKMFCPIEEFEVEVFKRMQDVSLNGPMVLCREFVKYAKSQGKGGSIINMLSKSAFWTNSNYNLGYASVKGGKAFMTKSLAHEVGPYGIRVNGVIPGYVAGPAVDQESDYYKKKAVMLPMGRWATPPEIADVIVFLCSDKAILINGDFVDCTGGCLCGDSLANVVQYRS